MQETILKYLNGLSADSKIRVTDYFKEEVEEYSLIISKVLAPLQNYIKINPAAEKDDPELIAYGLMTKGANTLMASFELSLNGYYCEPHILLRNALEVFASAWDIMHNPKRLKSWKENKNFKSTISITNAKEVNSVIGPFYGMLSNIYTHPSKLNFSPSFVLVEGKPKLQFFGLLRTGKENSRQGEVYLCLIITFMCLQMAELCFHRYTIEHETIEKIPGKLYVKMKVSERHQKFVDKAMKLFKDTLDDPLSRF